MVEVGEKIGEGLQRDVYKHKDIDNLVIKVVKDPHFIKHNRAEYDNWQVATEEQRKWLAPCVEISDCGKYLTQKMCGKLEELPKIPEWVKKIGDTDRLCQWGLYEDRPVVLDYGFKIK